MKNMKNLSKRGLALFLTLVMCLSMVQITAFAEGETQEPAAEIVEVEGSEVQVEAPAQDPEQPVQDAVLDDNGSEEPSDEPAADDATVDDTMDDAAVDSNTPEAITPPEETPVEIPDETPVETPVVPEEIVQDANSGIVGSIVDEIQNVMPVPAGVQAFLDAAAELPDASEVTAENAEEIGEQVSAALDLYEAVENETAEVTKALEAVYAVYEAVEAALELEDDTYYGTQYKPYYNAEITDKGYGTVVKGPTNTQARITAFVGEEWNFQRLPTQTYSGSICGHAMFVCAPKYYNLPSLKSYDDTIVQDDGYTIGTWNDKGLMPQMDGSDCLQWNFTALKPGKTTAQSHYYVRWDNYSNVSGGCPICGWSTNGFDNRGVYYEYQDNIPITVNARYQLVYDLNGGTGSISPTTRDIADTTATLGTTGTIPTHPQGYTFKGWKDEAGNMVDVSVTLNWSEGYGSKENPVTETLTAVWEDDTTPPTPSLEDLTVIKTSSEKYPTVGEEFKYTITVNNGNDTAVTVKVTDKLNEKLEFVRFSQSDGGVYDEDTHTVTWENVTVPAHGAKDLHVWVKATTVGEIYNEAKVEWEGGSVSGNTTVEAKPGTPTPTAPEKPTHDEVRKLINDTVKVVCEPGTHEDSTFGYSNAGQLDRITIGNVNESNGTYTCEVVFIAQKFCDAYNALKGTTGDKAHKLVNGEGNETVIFTWNATEEEWELPKDFEAPVTFYVECGKANIPYTLQYKANPGDADEVKNLPASETKYGTAPGAVNFTVSSQEPTRDGYTFAGWEVEDKLLHGGDTFTMKGSQYAVSVTQTLWATWTKNTDPGPGPGPGVTPDKAGLKLTKSVDTSNPELGGTVTYTITVSNETRVALKDLKIKDIMPAGVVLVKDSGKVTVDGTERDVVLKEDGQTCSWIVDGVIPVEGKVVLTYSATVPEEVTEETSLVNTAKAFAYQHEASPAPQMARGVAQYAASMANDFVSGSASTEFNVKGYDFTSNEGNATVTVKPGSGTNPGPVKPGKPNDDDLYKLQLGVQVVCDVENSNHSVTEYLLKTAECTIGEVTENADTATKEKYPYTCTVQLAGSGQDFYLGQKIKDIQDTWDKEHQLADRDRILTATLYHDGEKWTLPIDGGMNPDVAHGTNIKNWKYLVIHTVHKAEQLPGAKDTTYTVVHEYYTNNSLTGSSQSVENGKVGQTVNAANIIKVTTHGGNSYTYTSASPESLVLEDGGNIITLRYDRTTGGSSGGGGSRPTPRPDPEEPPVVDIPDPEVPLVEVPDVDVPLVDIPEEEVPLVELPEEEVPLADVPKTGARSLLWQMSAALSAAGLLILAVLERRQRRGE